MTRGVGRLLVNGIGDQLDKVSRSFALVIPTLEEPLNYYLATAYLICRVVDNIEDCTQSSVWKEERFLEFQHLAIEPTNALTILERWGHAPDHPVQLFPPLNEQTFVGNIVREGVLEHVGELGNARLLIDELERAQLANQ